MISVSIIHHRYTGEPLEEDLYTMGAKDDPKWRDEWLSVKESLPLDFPKYAILMILKT